MVPSDTDSCGRAGMMHGVLKEELFDILHNKQISTLFQPIISLRDGTVFGYEALSRGPHNSRLELPVSLIETASKNKLVLELEHLFRYSALQNAVKLPQNVKLFLNVNPNVILDERYSPGFTKNYLQQFYIDADRIIFEITERESVHNLAEFKSWLEHYKDLNYQVSIDDAGAGYSGLNLISDIQPHFIKLDMHLVRNIDKDLIKQALVKGMCEFAALTNTLIIAEGIETKEELSKLIEFDVAYGQGYFIQRPAPAITPVEKNVLSLIHGCNKIKNRFFGTRVNNFYVKNISRPSVSVTPDVTAASLQQFFAQDSSLHGVCVVEGGVPLGTITRRCFFQHLGGCPSLAAFVHLSARSIMTPDFLRVDYKAPLDIVSKKAMQRTYEALYDLIVITREEKYYGIVTVKDLLTKAIEIEVANAKNLNPLSGLPGNLAVEMQLERLLSFGQSRYVLYFDIDHFKPYNDLYGFECGDRVLACLARILKKSVPEGTFLGHAGGDDFIAILDVEQAEEVCVHVIAEFDKMVASFYTREDAENGYITVQNRMLVEEMFPLLSLSAAGVYSLHSKNMYELAERGEKLKQLCKQCAGSNCMIEEP